MVLTLAAGSMSATGFRQSPATESEYAQSAEEDPPPEWLIWNVTRWMPLVERWSPDFPDLEHALVLSMIAQESQGFPDAESDDGYSSVGLMQVIPRSWTGTRTQLLNPGFNIYVGMRMINATIKKSGGDVRRALALYNCGEKSLDAGKCYSFGGWTYADRVLDYWLPTFRAELQPTPTMPTASFRTTPERVAPPKATLTPTPITTSMATPSRGTEAVAAPPLTLTETPLLPSPTFTQTPIPVKSNEEVIDRTETFAVLTILAALLTGLFVTVRDWKRLGGKR